MKNFDLSRLPPRWVVKREKNDNRWQTVIDVLNFIGNDTKNDWKGNNNSLPYYGFDNECRYNSGVNNYGIVKKGVKLLSLDEFMCLLSPSKQSINNNYEIF